MNKLLIKVNKMQLARIATAVLITTAGGALAVSALLAETPKVRTSQTSSGQCTNWPCGNAAADCAKIQLSVQNAFEKLLGDASSGTAMGKQLRADLMDPTNTYFKAHMIVYDRLQQVGVFFTDDHHIIFYESENGVATPSGGIPGSGGTYPNNHCLHIFSLPSESTDGKPIVGVSFQQQLMCCYQPWPPPIEHTK